MTSIVTPRNKIVKNIVNYVLWRRQVIPMSRDEIIKVITNLTTERPPLFPTLGQKIPKSWLMCKVFLNKIRDLGCEDEEAIVKPELVRSITPWLE